MHSIGLSRERLRRILKILGDHGGRLSVRDFARSFGVQEIHLIEAEKFGWISIRIRKPRTGRPSRIVEKLSNVPSAKLPPIRSYLPTWISYKHRKFVEHYLLRGRGGNARRAYMATYPDARSISGVDASANRLLRHRNVRAYLAWIRACIDPEFPPDEKNQNPQSAWEIRQTFHRVGYWRLNQL
jgi:hypothetical protein